MANSQTRESAEKSGSADKRNRAVSPPILLLAALFCTILIGIAIWTVLGSRANGDLMLIYVPLLGAVFFCIPAVQAWVAFFQSVRRK